MSSLEKSFAKAKLAKLPLEPVYDFDERAEEVDTVEEVDGARSVSGTSTDSSSSASSTGTIRPSAGQYMFKRPTTGGSRLKPVPLHWQEFFEHEMFFDHETDDGLSIQHHAYLITPKDNGPLFVTHHGAGSSGLSFAAFGKEIVKLIPNAGVLSVDARHHGETTVTSKKNDQPVEMDLSLSTLARDVAFTVEATMTLLQSTSAPDIVLIGHSLGGAVVTEVAHERLLGTSVIGYGVLDVVEGSAMDALQSMDQYLLMRPSTFPSVSSGIEWHIRSRTIRNSVSARVSVPSLLRNESPSTPSASTWTWRTDLRATKPFWEDWFVGLSKKFLESRGGKLLILAGTDRLDKELMIGQMQGKYQLQVFPEAGHFVQEDQPAKTAQIVSDFYYRNDRSTLVLPPKVDDLIKQGKLKPSHR